MYKNTLSHSERELWFWVYLFTLNKLFSRLLEDYIVIYVTQYLCLILLTLTRYVCKLRTLNPKGRVLMITFLQLNRACQKKAREKGKESIQLEWGKVMRGLHAHIVKSKDTKRRSVGYYSQNWNRSGLRIGKGRKNHGYRWGPWIILQGWNKDNNWRWER